MDGETDDDGAAAAAGPDPGGAALDLYTGTDEAHRPKARDAYADYVPGTRSSLPANDSLAGLTYMAGVPVIAQEVARAMAARGGFEELIAHQVAAGHAFSMNVISQCNNQFLSATARAGQSNCSLGMGSIGRIQTPLPPAGRRDDARRMSRT